MRVRRLKNFYRLISAFGAIMIVSTFLVTPSASAGPGTITGTVFNDFDADGTMDTAASGQVDSGIGGVTVTAYDNSGACGTATTTANGTYTLSHTCVSTTVRVEFAATAPIHDGLQPGPIAAPGATGTLSGSTVQFAGSTSSGVNVGFLRPTDYCQASPQLVSSCFMNGTANNDRATDKAIARWSYNASGNPTIGADKLVAKVDVGSIFGLAHSRSRNTIYAAAVLRRHVGMGPSGLGAIYAIDDTTGAVSLLKNLGASVGTFDENTRDLGQSFSPSHDDAAAENVGKVGIGDLAITEDEQSLVFANLSTGTIMLTPVSNATSTTSLGAPNPGCGSSVVRPWGVAVRGSKVFAGVVCEDASLGAVMSTPLSGGSWTTEVSLPLPSMTTPTTWSTAGDSWKAWVPWGDKQPLVSDISFDADGSMTISIMDRRGYITGSNNYDYNSNNLAAYGTTAGDTVRACHNGTAYVLESAGTCGSVTGAANGQGNGGGEFYVGDSWFTQNGPSEGHYEISLGATALLPGSGEVVSTVFDPTDWLTYGTRALSQTNGTEVRSYQIVGTPTNEPGSLGKAAGMGDIELLCDQAPIEIGNRVWNDADGDGQQDPDEAPIAGVQVRLLDSGGNELATATTNSIGVYSFSSASGTSDAAQRYGISALTPNTQFTVDIPSAQTPLVGFATTRTNAASVADTVDSDGTRVAVNGAQAIHTTGLAGHDNHTIDFGFYRQFSLGDLVFLDADNSGLFDGADTPAVGVAVHLFRNTQSGLVAATTAGGAAIGTATTDSNGVYRFDDLLAGEYVVVVDPASSALTGTLSSTGAGESGTPDNDVNNDDNGLNTPLGSGTVFPGGIASAVVTLGAAAVEPTTDNHGFSNSVGEAINAQSNRSLDFGFAPIPPSTTTTSSTTTSSTTTTSTTTTSTTTTEPTTTEPTTTEPTTTSSTTTSSSSTTSTTIEPTTTSSTTTTTEPTTTTTTTIEPTTTSSTTSSSTTTSSTTSTVPTTSATTTPTTVTTTVPTTTATTTPSTTPSTVESTVATTVDPTPTVPLSPVTPAGSSTPPDTASTSTTVDPAPAPSVGELNAPPSSASGPGASTTVPSRNEEGAGVSGVIFVDSDTDGTQDPGEVALPGVTVEIRSATGTLVGTVQTDSAGRFAVAVDASGDYTVTIVAGVPPEYSFLTDQTISVRVLSSGVSRSEAVFRVNSSPSAELAFTGFAQGRLLLLGLGLLSIGLTMLATQRRSRRR